MQRLLLLLMLFGSNPSDCLITQDPPRQAMEYENISFEESIKIVDKLFNIKDMNFGEFYKKSSQLLDWKEGIWKVPKDERKKYGIPELNVQRIADIIRCRLKRLSTIEEKKRTIEILISLLEIDTTNKHFLFMEGTSPSNDPWSGFKACALDTLSVIGDQNIIPRLRELYITSEVVTYHNYKKAIDILGGEVTEQEMERRRDFLKSKYPQESNYWECF